MTRAEDVLEQFCTSPDTGQLLARWRADPSKREVVPAVLGHKTRVVYALTVDDVKAVCRQTEHALGEVRREDGEAVNGIVNWHPDFAFAHMFHICMEKCARLPTYQEFRHFMDNDDLGRVMLGGPARDKVREMVSFNVAKHLAGAAMRWRVGNAYYSFLREVYTVTSLRQAGIDLQVHPLADALFRVDAWVGRTVLSLRVGNKKFSEGENYGRKRRPEDLLADVVPPLNFQTIELLPATKFGRVHLPSSAELAAAAMLLRDG